MFSKMCFFQKYKKSLLAGFIIVYVLELLFLSAMRFNILPKTVYFALAILAGFSFFFFLVSIFYSFLTWLYEKYLIRVELQEERMSELLKEERKGRRRFLKLCFDIWFLILASGCLLKGLFNANKLPDIKKIEVASDKIKDDLNLVIITDLHLGRNLHESFLSGLVNRVNALNPDAIFIVGDLIDSNVLDIDYLHLLSDFKSKFGTFYVTGNHEYYHGIEAILSAISKEDLTILSNTNKTCDTFTVSGVHDMTGFKGYDIELAPDLEKAKLGLDKSKLNILLVHQPRYAKLEDLNDFDLVFAGHTHAGQIFPFSIVVYLQQGFLHGLYKLGEKTQMYVSSGAGYWGPAIRFLAPSEIVQFVVKGEKR